MKIQINKNYYTTTTAEQFECCGELQFITYSEANDTEMGCQFCEFDIYE
jgi:hypothetical protein